MPKVSAKQAGKLFVGVDPGKSGGLAALRPDNQIVIEKMPPTEADILEWFQAQKACGLPMFAVIEKVNGYIGKPQPGSAMFTFGWGYGGLRMAMLACGIPFDEVTPQKWQKAMGCLTKGDKNVSKTKAQQLFPDQKVTHATADALLLMEYCKRTYGG